MRISDGSSDVCSSDLPTSPWAFLFRHFPKEPCCRAMQAAKPSCLSGAPADCSPLVRSARTTARHLLAVLSSKRRSDAHGTMPASTCARAEYSARPHDKRSEEHTSELPSLMHSSYAGFVLKKQKI